MPVPEIGFVRPHAAAATRISNTSLTVGFEGRPYQSSAVSVSAGPGLLETARGRGNKEFALSFDVRLHTAIVRRSNQCPERNREQAQGKSKRKAKSKSKTKETSRRKNEVKSKGDIRSKGGAIASATAKLGSLTGARATARARAQARPNHEQDQEQAQEQEQRH